MKKIFTLLAILSVSTFESVAQAPAITDISISTNFYTSRSLHATSSIELQPGFSVNTNGFDASITGNDFQPCPVVGIKTNPTDYYDPGHPLVYFDPANPTKFTPFNWVSPVSPRRDEYNIFWSRQSPPVTQTFATPFNQYSNNPRLDFKKQNPDIPKDGWELIRMDLGYNDDGTTRTTCINPYIIIYNKYLAILRVYYAVGTSSGNFDYSRMDLAFSTSGTITNKTGALNHLTGLGTPLQDTRPGNVDKISVVNKFDNSTGGGIGSWFMADFPMDYDPCTCLHQGQFVLEISLIQTSHIKQTGQFIGTLTTIDGGKSAGDNVADGSADRKTFTYINGALNSAYTSFNGASDLVKNIYTPSVNNNLTDLNKLVKDIADPLSAFQKGLNAIPYIGAAVGLLDYFITGGNANSGPQSVAVEPMAIQASITLEGDITTNGYWGGTNFRVPGSMAAPVVSGAGVAVTPYYNEVLGVFNLLESPILDNQTLQSSFVSSSYPSNSIRFSRSVQFTQPLKFVINPAAGLHLAGMKAALVGTYSNADPTAYNTTQYAGGNTGYLYKEGDSGNAIWPAGTPQAGQLKNEVYIRTDYVDVGCLSNYTFTSNTLGFYSLSSANNYNIIRPYEIYNDRIKLLIDLVRDDNGAHVLLVTTYPIRFNTPSSSLSGRPNTGCTTPLPVAQTQPQITAFCNSDVKYNGSIALRVASPSATKPQANQANLTQFAFFPNPANEFATVRFAIEQPSNVQLYIKNELGQVVRELINRDLEPGLIDQQIDTRSLSPGIYFCTLVTNNHVQVLKVSIVK